MSRARAAWCAAFLSLLLESEPSNAATAPSPAIVVAAFPGVHAVAEPDANSRAVKQDLELLEPYEVRRTKGDFLLLHKILDPNERSEVGWVKKSFVLPWTSRHALLPVGTDSDVKGFCAKEELSQFLDGKKGPGPCAVMPSNVPGALEKQNDNINLRPFPVIGADRVMNKRHMPVYLLQALLPASFASMAAYEKKRESRVMGSFKVFDIVIILDRTESMEPERAAVNEFLVSLLKASQSKGLDVRVNLITYGGRNVTATGLQPIGPILKALDEKVGGGEEYMIDAFWLSTLTQWRHEEQGANRVVIFLGDEPAERADDNPTATPLSCGCGRDKSGHGTTPGGKTFDDLFEVLARSYEGRVHFFPLPLPETAENLRLLKADLGKFFDMNKTNRSGHPALFATAEEPPAFQKGATLRKDLKSTSDLLWKRMMEMVDAAENNFVEAKIAPQVVKFRGADDRYLQILKGLYNDECVIQQVWVREDSDGFEDVFLINRREITDTLKVLKSLGPLLGRNRAEAKLVPQIDALWSLITGRKNRKHHETMDDPLWDYWGVRHQQGSLLSMTPLQITSMTPDARTAKVKQINEAIRTLSRLGDDKSREWFWVPFRYLP